MILNISIKELKLWKNGEIHWALESLGTCRDVFRAGDDHIGIIPAFKPWFRPAGITAACIAVSLIHGWLVFIPCWYHQWGQKCHFHTLQNLLCWSLLKVLVFLTRVANNTTMPSTNIIKHLQTKLYKNCYIHCRPRSQTWIQRLPLCRCGTMLVQQFPTGQKISCHAALPQAPFRTFNFEPQTLAASHQTWTGNIKYPIVSVCIPIFSRAYGELQPKLHG